MTQAHLKITSLHSQLQIIGEIPPVVTELWEYLDESLSYDIENSYFIKASSGKKFIREMWDGKKHLFNVKSGKFLTGLLPYVKIALDHFKIEYTEEDLRPIYEKTSISMKGDKVEVREYQQDALNQILAHKRGIIFARPRSGKTLIEILLHSRVGLTPHLSICQRLDIAWQTKEKFERFLPGVKVGIIGDGEVDIQDVTIVTIQSLASVYGLSYSPEKEEKKENHPRTLDTQRIKNLVETSKIVWVDESHHASSSVHKFILENKIYAAEFVIGSSGTPFREDNTDKHIEGMLGPIIYEIGYSELIKLGYLIRPTIHVIKIPRAISTDNKYYSTIYKECIVENDFRNGIIQRAVENLNSREKSCMIIVSKIGHGKILEKMIKGSKFVYSKTKDRKAAWKDLKSKKILTLITTLGDEGLDIPSLDATVIASGGKSAIKAFQRLRCLTPSKNGTQEKEYAIVIDFLDPYKYLKSHSQKRLRLYNSEPMFKVVKRDAK